MFSNVHPKLKRDIEWGWVRRYNDCGGWMVKEPLGFIRMPDWDEYFDWDCFEVEQPAIHEKLWRPGEGLTLGTRNMKSIFTTAARFLGYEKLLIEQSDISEIAYSFFEWNEYLLNIWGNKLDYFMIGDDYASNIGMMMSPACWRDWIKPYIEELIHLAKMWELEVIFHSDGDIFALLKDFDEMGVNVLNYERVGQMAQFKTGDTWRGIELWENAVDPINHRII